MAEFHRGGVANLFAADTDVHFGTNLFAEGNSHIHQTANTVLSIFVKKSPKGIALGGVVIYRLFKFVN